MQYNDKVMALRETISMGQVGRGMCLIIFLIKILTCVLSCFNVPIFESFVTVSHRLLNWWNLVKEFLQMSEINFKWFKLFDAFCVTDLLTSNRLFDKGNIVLFATLLRTKHNHRKFVFFRILEHRRN